MFEAAEWRLLIVQHAVDRNTAGKEPGSYAARAIYVGTAYEGVKAEIRVVGDPDRVFLVFVTAQLFAVHQMLGERNHGSNETGSTSNAFGQAGQPQPESGSFLLGAQKG